MKGKNDMKKLIIAMLLAISALTVCVVPISAEYYDDYYYEEDDGGISFGTVAISAVVGFGISFAIVSVQKSAMKTVRRERAARNYIDEGSMKLTDSSELYIRTSVSRTPKKKD